jgi:hypothetical protein
VSLVLVVGAGSATLGFAASFDVTASKQRPQRVKRHRLFMTYLSCMVGIGDSLTRIPHSGHG